jgi:hypothetical protein
MPIKLAKRHSSPFWYLRGTVRGVIVDESTKVDDREQAEKHLAAYLAETSRQICEMSRQPPRFQKIDVDMLDVRRINRLFHTSRA